MLTVRQRLDYYPHAEEMKRDSRYQFGIHYSSILDDKVLCSIDMLKNYFWLKYVQQLSPFSPALTPQENYVLKNIGHLMTHLLCCMSMNNPLERQRLLDFIELYFDNIRNALMSPAAEQ